MTRSFDIGCTVRVCHTSEDLSAHVTLDDGVEAGPGDVVHVHGDPIHPAYGEVWEGRRQATVTRAGWLRRAWVRLTGDFEFQELLEVSFTDQRTL